ncbi:MFS transporter [Candidatus Woesearchaeota archaeon]|nr:MFS transporter [Candidatus Woesearchaeota archaeon]
MAFFKQGEFGILGLFYLAGFVQALLAVVEPIVVVYFALKGFTFSELSFALVGFFIAPFIFEVPTGVVADVFGRKLSVVLSFLLMGIGAAYVPFVSNFVMLFALLFFIGFAKTLSSGADQAWVVDNIRYNKRPGLIHEFYLKSQSLNMAAFVGSGLLTAWLIVLLGKGVLLNFRGVDLIGLDFLWFVYAAGFIVPALILLFTREHLVTRRIHPRHFARHSMNKFRLGFRHSFDNPIIFHLLLAAFFMAFAGNIFGIAYQPFLVGLGIPTHYLGYMTSIIGGFGIFVPFIARRLSRLIKKEKYYLTFVAAVNAVLIFAAFFVVSPFVGLTLIILLANVGNFEQAIEKPYFQKYLESHIRATVASFESMFVHVGGALAMLLGGFLADLIGPRLTLTSAAVFVLPALVSYLTIHGRRPRIT